MIQAELIFAITLTPSVHLHVRVPVDTNNAITHKQCLYLHSFNIVLLPEKVQLTVCGELSNIPVQVTHLFICTVTSLLG